MHLIRTGGVIALGLATRNWTVEQCSEHFKSICKDAFSHRAGHDIPGIGWLVESINNYKYETQSLETALKRAFSDSQYLFGGPRPNDASQFHVKAAVVTSTPGGNTTVLANYNRHSSDRCKKSSAFNREMLTFSKPSSLSILPV